MTQKKHTAWMDKKLAILFEHCVKATHLAMANQYPGGKILMIGEGAACFAGLDSFFSQLIGWGFATKMRDLAAEIERVEQFYRDLNHDRVDIELCPLIGRAIPVYLSQQGYTISELNNVSFLPLDAYQHQLPSEQIIIQAVIAKDHAEWAKNVALGFGYPEAQQQFLQYAGLPSVRAFAAYVRGEMVAGGTLAIHNGVADLAVTSTLPSYRGLGIQKHLINARLNYAKERQIDFAMVTTEPGSISDLNVQKSGFSCGYTRIKLVKALQ